MTDTHDPVRAMAERTTILRVPAGSNLHGLHLPGTDDRDEAGVCVEDMAAAMGFSEFEQYIYRSAAEREGKHDAPSQPGDLDLTIYSLKKFLRLAMQGNPQLLQCLFVPPELCIDRSTLGDALQALAPAIVSRQAGKRYLGYLEAQRQRLLGERGQKKVNRPGLEAAHGYDTKYACHVWRLAVQGVELLSTGRITLPMTKANREFGQGIRRGQVDLQRVLTRAGELERDLKDLVTSGPLRDEPDRDAIEAWMLRIYLESWRADTGTMRPEYDFTHVVRGTPQTVGIMRVVDPPPPPRPVRPSAQPCGCDEGINYKCALHGGQ